MSAVTGLPVRFYWAGLDEAELFFRRLPGDIRISAVVGILPTQWPTAIGVCGCGMASDVSSISASGSCSVSSSTV
jgi:hypothetical protein